MSHVIFCRPFKPVTYGISTTWDSSNKTSNMILSNGDLTASESVGTFEAVRAVYGSDTETQYWEITVDNIGTNPNDTYLGIVSASGVFSGGLMTGVSWRSGLGFLLVVGGAVAVSGDPIIDAGYGQGDVIQFFMDYTNNELYIGINGTWANSDLPAVTNIDNVVQHTL